MGYVDTIGVIVASVDVVCPVAVPINVVSPGVEDAAYDAAVAVAYFVVSPGVLGIAVTEVVYVALAVV